MKLPDGREIRNLVSRVDNIVFLTPEVNPADSPGAFNVWERSGEPYRLFANTDLFPMTFPIGKMVSVVTI